MSTERVWSQKELLALARLDDDGGFSPLGQPPFLLFRAEPATPASSMETRRVVLRIDGAPEGCALRREEEREGEA